MATPWPNQPCPYCGERLTDLLAEMVEPSRKGSAEQMALINTQPGGAITCPYCQRAIEFNATGSLVVSNLVPLRYSRPLIEKRAIDFGQHFLGRDLTPEEWIEVDKAMPGALQGYRYAEDGP